MELSLNFGPEFTSDIQVDATYEDACTDYMDFEKCTSGRFCYEDNLNWVGYYSAEEDDFTNKVSEKVDDNNEEGIVCGIQEVEEVSTGFDDDDAAPVAVQVAFAGPIPDYEDNEEWINEEFVDED